jgi:hypothetical protein
MFPHQVSLGDRAVGWLKCEVEEWINERIGLRPDSATWNSERELEQGIEITKDLRGERPRPRRIIEPMNCSVSVNDRAPDAAQLHLVGTKI